MAENIFKNQGLFVGDEEAPRRVAGGEDAPSFQSLSGIDTTLEDVSRPAFQTQKRKFDASQDRRSAKKSVESARFKGDILGGVQSGLALGVQDTGETEFASTDSIIKILGGAGTGFLVGGPAGAIAGGLASGLQAFLGTRANKKKAKAQKAKENRYQKMVKEQIARDDKFRKEDRFDRLRTEGKTRARQKQEANWSLYRDFNKQFTDMINSNADLKSRFAAQGF